MQYLWAKSLETGNTVIDSQHKQLFTELTNLFDAYRSGKEQQGIEKTLEFMKTYVLKHFADEEKLQEEHNYPEYIAHKKLHDEFKDVVQTFVAKLSQSGPTDDFFLEVYTVFHEWLVNHIKIEDLKIARYIQGSKAN